jgi:hypothetical protein
VGEFTKCCYVRDAPLPLYTAPSCSSPVRSFDGRTIKGGKRGFFGIVAHFANASGVIQDLPIDLKQLAGSHKGELLHLLLLKLSKYTVLLAISWVTLYSTTPRIMTLQLLRLLAYTASTLLIDAFVVAPTRSILSARRTYLMRIERLITTLLSSLQQRSCTCRSGVKMGR